LQGQTSLPFTEPGLRTLVEPVRRRRSTPLPPRAGRKPSPILSIDTDRVEIEQAREAGPVQVGHQMWRQLQLDAILGGAGLSPQAILLTQAMSLNRLIFPLSEQAMPDWIRRTALGDILGMDFSPLNDDALYRNLDRLHRNRERIERELAEREKTLFNIWTTRCIYMTSDRPTSKGRPCVTGRPSGATNATSGAMASRW